MRFLTQFCNYGRMFQMVTRRGPWRRRGETR